MVVERTIGAMRHQAVIQQPVESRGASGQVAITWTTLVVRRCSVEPVMGGTLVQGTVVRPGVTHHVNMRYVEGVTPRHRLLVNGVLTLSIDSVFNPDMQKRYLSLQCVEEVP